MFADHKKKPTLDMFMATPIFEEAMKRKGKVGNGAREVNQQEFLRLVSSWAKPKR